MKRFWIWAGVLIIAGNLLALAGTAWNRSGTPSSRVTLTQQELQARYDWHKENSGIRLALNWRMPSNKNDCSVYRREPDLSLADMQALGFATPTQLDKETARRYSRQLARPILLVLELNGERYQQQLALRQRCLEQAQQAASAMANNENLQYELKSQQRELDRERNENTRLFVIDSGLDESVLRARYPDPARYLIIPAQAEPLAYLHRENEWVIGGSVRRIEGTSINVPQRWRAALREAIGKTPEEPLKMNVELSFGKRLEPWIEHLEVNPAR